VMMSVMIVDVQSVEGEPHEKAVELLKAAQGLSVGLSALNDSHMS